MPEIKPALTAEEWEEFAVHPDSVLMRNGQVNYRNLGLTLRTLALANAALPNDDPRKITRADVEALNEAGDLDMDAADAGGDVPRLAVRLYRLRDKLAALLPPEETA